MRKNASPTTDAIIMKEAATLNPQFQGCGRAITEHVGDTQLERLQAFHHAIDHKQRMGIKVSNDLRVQCERKLTNESTQLCISTFAAEFKRLFTWNAESEKFVIANTTSDFEEVINILDNLKKGQGNRQIDNTRSMAFTAATTPNLPPPEASQKKRWGV